MPPRRVNEYGRDLVAPREERPRLEVGIVVTSNEMAKSTDKGKGKRNQQNNQ